MIKRILVPLDGSKLGEKAVPYAELLAQKLGAELILVHVLQAALVTSDHGASALYSPQVLAEEKEVTLYLNSIRGQLRGLNVTTHIAVLSGRSVSEAIVDLSRQESVDMIVMSSHGRSGLNRWLYGSVASRVVEQASCPVFLVRAFENDFPRN